QLATGLRFEWFRDQDGTQVSPDGNKNHYFAITAGLNYSPLSWLMIRPEVRYDWVTGANEFDAGAASDQVLISADAIIRF
ncbi:MAG: outer membrane beta-barrel protein, partial [Methylomicrobium sp.]|nr:outer membrane beta-barrel protein [Methylomicrobium sp.]